MFFISRPLRSITGRLCCNTNTDRPVERVGAKDPTSPQPCHNLVLPHPGPTDWSTTSWVTSGGLLECPFSIMEKKFNLCAPKSPHNTDQSLSRGKNQATCFKSAFLIQGHTYTDGADAFKPTSF